MKKFLFKFTRWLFHIPEPKKELTKFEKAELARKEMRKLMEKRRQKKKLGGD